MGDGVLVILDDIDNCHFHIDSNLLYLTYIRQNNEYTRFIKIC